MTTHDRLPEGAGPDDRATHDTGDDALLALLRDAWQGLEPPTPTPSIEDTDELTRAGIAWTRAAWERLEAPPARVPLPLRLRTTRAAPWRRIAAAAALLLAVLLGRGMRPDLVGDSRPIEATDATALAEPGAAAPRVVAVADDHIEFRSGNVRLVLLTPTPGVAP